MYEGTKKPANDIIISKNFCSCLVIVCIAVHLVNGQFASHFLGRFNAWRVDSWMEQSVGRTERNGRTDLLDFIGKNPNGHAGPGTLTRTHTKLCEN